MVDDGETGNNLNWLVFSDHSIIEQQNGAKRSRIKNRMIKLKQFHEQFDPPPDDPSGKKSKSWHGRQNSEASTFGRNYE